MIPWTLPFQSCNLPHSIFVRNQLLQNLILNYLIYTHQILCAIIIIVRLILQLMLGQMQALFLFVEGVTSFG